MKRQTRIGRLALLLAVVLFLPVLFACDKTENYLNQTQNLSEKADVTDTSIPITTAALTERPLGVPTATPVPQPSVSEWVERSGGKYTLHGSEAPTQALGEDGAFYVSEQEQVLYYKEGGEWLNCGKYRSAGYRLVNFSTNRGDELPVQLVRSGEKAKDPGLVPDVGFVGWYADTYAGVWDFDADVIEEDTQFCGYWYETLERREPLLTYKDWRRGLLETNGEIGVLVIFVGVTDGHVPDKAMFEDTFNGDYDLDNCLRSVSSYYKYASYGKVSFDFRFYYYDTGLSSAEAFQKMRSDYDYQKNIFMAIRKAQPKLMQELDKNGDGYVDCVAFIGGEDTHKTYDSGGSYTLFGTVSGLESTKPDKKNPTLGRYICSNYEELTGDSLQPGNQYGGIRTYVHELGHAFGLIDYYDHASYPDRYSFTSTVGSFDMQANDVGDWNPFSRFGVGWLAPYVVTEDTDEITVKIGCSSETPDCILLPTSLGWNGTPFDEYILIDVMAPVGANGFDWSIVTDPWFMRMDEQCIYGGVRAYHVDSQLMKGVWSHTKDNGVQIQFIERLTTYEELLAVINSKGTKTWDDELHEAFLNTNGYEPYLESDSRFYHLIDLIPRDGSSKFRLSTPTGMTAFTILSCSDLFGPGDVFSMETAHDAFADAPRMNNGGTFDYSVRVDHYDPETYEAVITITKNR